MKVQLAGRLGNQLFIWAFALDLALSNNHKVDIFTDKYHNMEKNSVEIRELIADNDYISISHRNQLGRLLQIVDKFANSLPIVATLLTSIFRINTQDSPYLDPVLGTNPRIFRGYYQSSTYTQRNLKAITSALNPIIVNKFDAIKNRLKLKVIAQEYQCIHVRRGDYIDNPELGELAVEYYLQNINKALPIVVCTDAINLPKDFREAFPEALCLNSEISTAWEALAIMANAKHLVMANSTLSWWGGLIASSRGSMVISPEPWFKAQSIPSGHFQINGMTAANSHFI